MELRCFRLGEEKMPGWFIKKVGQGKCKLRRTDKGVLCCRFIDGHGNEKQVIQGEVITSDMLSD